MKPFKGIPYDIYLDGKRITRLRFLVPLKPHQIDRALRDYAEFNMLDAEKLEARRWHGV